MSIQRWVIGSFGLAAFISFWVFQQLVDLVWGVFSLPLYEEWFVGPEDLAALVLAVVVFWGLKKYKRGTEFMTEVFNELVKVTWPQRKETLISAVIVIVMVSIAGVILATFDTIWGTLTQQLFLKKG